MKKVAVFLITSNLFFLFLFSKENGATNFFNSSNSRVKIDKDFLEDNSFNPTINKDLSVPIPSTSVPNKKSKTQSYTYNNSEKWTYNTQTNIYTQDISDNYGSYGKVSFKISSKTKILSGMIEQSLLGVEKIGQNKEVYRYQINEYTEELGDLKKDNVIVSGNQSKYGLGYMKKVELVKKVGNEYHIYTTNAALNETFDMLKVDIHKVLVTDNQIENNYSKIDLKENFKYLFNSAFNLSKIFMLTEKKLYAANITKPSNKLFEIGKSFNTTEGVKTGYYIVVYGDLDLEIDMPNPRTLKKFVYLVNMKKDLELAMEVVIPMTADKTFSKEFKFAKIPSIQISLIPPFDMEITPSFGISARLGPRFNVKLKGEAGMRTGIVCNNSCFSPSNYVPIGKYYENFRIDEREFLPARFIIGPELLYSVKLAEIIGPFLSAFVGGRADIKVDLNKGKGLGYKISARAEVNGGLAASIEKWFVNVKLFELSMNLLEYEKVIAEGYTNKE